MGSLAAVQIWFQGRKTILGGSLLIVCGVVGAFDGKLSLIDATTVAGFGLSICGLGAKANRFLGALEGVATAGVDLRLGNRAGAAAALRSAAIQAAQQVAEPELAPTALPEPTAAPAPIAAPLRPSGSTDLSPYAPVLSGDDAMRPGPARVATAAERAELWAKAMGQGDGRGRS